MLPSVSPAGSEEELSGAEDCSEELEGSELEGSELETSELEELSGVLLEVLGSLEQPASMERARAAARAIAKSLHVFFILFSSNSFIQNGIRHLISVYYFKNPDARADFTLNL